MKSKIFIITLCITLASCSKHDSEFVKYCKYQKGFEELLSKSRRIYPLPSQSTKRDQWALNEHSKLTKKLNIYNVSEYQRKTQIKNGWYQELCKEKGLW